LFQRDSEIAELLAALEKIIVCDAPAMRDAQLRSRRLVDAADIARAAIAKAKGGAA
jgi:hypothetical protein